MIATRNRAPLFLLAVLHIAIGARAEVPEHLRPHPDDPDQSPLPEFDHEKMPVHADPLHQLLRREGLDEDHGLSEEQLDELEHDHGVLHEIIQDDHEEDEFMAAPDETHGDDMLPTCKCLNRYWWLCGLYWDLSLCECRR